MQVNVVPGGGSPRPTCRYGKKPVRGDSQGRPVLADERSKLLAGPQEPGGFVALTPSYTGLRKKFLYPPFSVFFTQEGGWAKRKRQWLALGIRSEVGRKASIERDENGRVTKVEGLTYSRACGFVSEIIASRGGGTSVFDPVLTELCYRWFCPEGGQVIDPFAGGSVRGIVARVLGYSYWGIELRPEQVEANREQATQILQDCEAPVWVCGDAAKLLPSAPVADFVFSCPPYGNLEVYSKLEGDLSNMEYPEFIEAYRHIIGLAVGRLREDRFACFVVANFRDKRTGFYRDLVGDTVKAFRWAGAALYNEAVLVTPYGSLPVRVANQFQASRKLGKTHQNILVFYKGDPGAIRSLFGQQ